MLWNTLFYVVYWLKYNNIYLHFAQYVINSLILNFEFMTNYFDFIQASPTFYVYRAIQASPTFYVIV